MQPLPRVLPIDREKPQAHVVDEAVRQLAQGALVAAPTETFYGVLVDPRVESAVRRLLRLKDRREGVPVVAADIAQVETSVGRLGPASRRLAEQFWPGPLALIVPVQGGALGRLGRDGGLAIRVSGHPVPRAVAHGLGYPITATSANRAGQSPATTASEVVAALDEAIDLVLDGGPTVGGAPSTIVKADGGNVQLVRAGAIPWERVLELLEWDT